MKTFVRMQVAGVYEKAAKMRQGQHRSYTPSQTQWNALCRTRRTVRRTSEARLTSVQNNRTQ